MDLLNRLMCKQHSIAKATVAIKESMTELQVVGIIEPVEVAEVLLDEVKFDKDLRAKDAYDKKWNKLTAKQKATLKKAAEDAHKAFAESKLTEDCKDKSDFDKGAKVRKELLAKAREMDKKDYIITDVTPEGYGPNESKLDKALKENEMSFEEIKAETISAIENMRRNTNQWSVRDTLKIFTKWGFWKAGEMASIDVETANKIADELIDYIQTTPQKQDVEDAYDEVYHYAIKETKLNEAPKKEKDEFDNVRDDKETIDDKEAVDNEEVIDDKATDEDVSDEMLDDEIKGTTNAVDSTIGDNDTVDEVAVEDSPFPDDKEYFGKMNDTHYYLVGVKTEEGDTRDDVQLLDQEETMVYSAKENGVDITDVAKVIDEIIKEIEVEEISTDIFVKYLRPKLDEPEVIDGDTEFTEEEFGVDEEVTDEEIVAEEDDDNTADEDFEEKPMKKKNESINETNIYQMYADYRDSGLNAKTALEKTEKALDFPEKFSGSKLETKYDLENTKNKSTNEKKAPMCSKCNKAHWPFKSCDSSECICTTITVNENLYDLTIDGVDFYINNKIYPLSEDTLKFYKLAEENDLCELGNDIISVMNESEIEELIENKKEKIMKKVNEDLANDVKSLQKEAEAAIKSGDFIKAAELVQKLSGVEIAVGVVDTDTTDAVIDTDDIDTETKNDDYKEEMKDDDIDEEMKDDDYKDDIDEEIKDDDIDENKKVEENTKEVTDTKTDEGIKVDVVKDGELEKLRKLKEKEAKIKEVDTSNGVKPDLGIMENIFSATRRVLND